MRSIPGVTIAALCGLLQIPASGWAGGPAIPQPRQKLLAQAQHSLQIPASIATVTDAEIHGRKLPEFVLIQDVHRHPEAQHHIADLIVQAHTAWKVGSVFIEGAFDKVNLSGLEGTP